MLGLPQGQPYLDVGKVHEVCLQRLEDLKYGGGLHKARLRGRMWPKHDRDGQQYHAWVTILWLRAPNQFHCLATKPLFL